MGIKTDFQDETPLPYLGDGQDEKVCTQQTPNRRQLKANYRQHESPLYHLKTLYLFSKANIKCVTVPQTLFALCTALSGPLLTTNSTPSLLSTVSQLPILLVWISINLLICDIS